MKAKRKPRTDKGMTRLEYRAEQAEIDRVISGATEFVDYLIRKYPWYREKLRKERILPRWAQKEYAH